MDSWDWALARSEYLVGDVDRTARKACRHFKHDGDAIVPKLIGAVVMSDGRLYEQSVDPNTKVAMESVEDAVESIFGNMPDGDMMARRISKTLDKEAAKGRSYEAPVAAEL